MHIADILGVCVSLAVIALVSGVLARQRFMLRADGALPAAIRAGSRWRYGIARFVDAELRWYRTFGIGTRPSQVLSRQDLVIVGSRAPGQAELSALPPHAVIVECRAGDRTTVLALSEDAFTGLVSWLEAAPHR